jgi:hypothetical protein
MRSLFTLGIALACSAAAADSNALMASCIGLDGTGMTRCMGIIARSEYGPLPSIRPFTLAEKTGIDAVMAAHPQTFIVVLPDGSFVIGQQVANRVIGIPCESNPCPSR